MANETLHKRSATGCPRVPARAEDVDARDRVARAPCPTLQRSCTSTTERRCSSGHDRTATTAQQMGANPVVSFAIDEYTPDWRETKGIQGTGNCQVVLDSVEIDVWSRRSRRSSPRSRARSTSGADVLPHHADATPVHRQQRARGRRHRRPVPPRSGLQHLPGPPRAGGREPRGAAPDDRGPGRRGDRAPGGARRQVLHHRRGRGRGHARIGGKDAGCSGRSAAARSSGRSRSSATRPATPPCVRPRADDAFLRWSVTSSAGWLRSPWARRPTSTASSSSGSRSAGTRSSAERGKRAWSRPRSTQPPGRQEFGGSEFRNTVGSFATGVTVITTRGRRRRRRGRIRDDGERLLVGLTRPASRTRLRHQRHDRVPRRSSATACSRSTCSELIRSRSRAFFSSRDRPIRAGGVRRAAALPAGDGVADPRTGGCVPRLSRAGLPDTKRGII